MNFEIRLSTKSSFTNRTLIMRWNKSIKSEFLIIDTHIEMASFHCAASCEHSSCSPTTKPYRKLCTLAVYCLVLSSSPSFATQRLRSESDEWLAAASDSWFPAWCDPPGSAWCRCVAVNKPSKYARTTKSSLTFWRLSLSSLIVMTVCWTWFCCWRTAAVWCCWTICVVICVGHDDW